MLWVAMSRGHPDAWGVAAVARVLCAAVLLLCPAQPAVGSSAAPEAARPASTAGGGVAEEVFPAAGGGATAWRVCWRHAPGEGLFIAGAWYRPTAGAEWVQVLAGLRLSDVFVSGHAVPFDPAAVADPAAPVPPVEEPRRFVLAETAPPLLPVSAADLGADGERADGYVVRRVRDRGIARKTAGATVRGRELVLAAAFADRAAAGGPVVYLLRYAFRDDGGVEVRLGVSTDGRSTGRSHLALWRVDVDLGGPAGDAVVLHRHLEPEGAVAAFDSSTFFNVSREGGVSRQALGFTSLGVLDLDRQRDLRRAAGWDLVPRAAGLARHREPFTRHDLWVSRYHRGETSYRDLPLYVADGEEITGADVVLWHATPVHLGEGWGDGAGGVEWTGFDLLPRRLTELLADGGG